eukprot:12277708-Prorocentrum_lima.AAC.1
MTSSLVGSEMCIRDSHAPAIGTACRAAVLARQHHRSALCLPSRPTLRSVSYTHLTLPTICSV